MFKEAASRYTAGCKEKTRHSGAKGGVAMENRSVTPMRIAKTGYIVMSAVFCAAGVLFIVLPEQAAVVTRVIEAIYKSAETGETIFFD